MSRSIERTVAALKPDERALVRDLLDRGWTATGVTGSGHLKMRHSSGQTIVVSRSPGDHRGQRNLRSVINHIEHNA